MRDVEVPGGTTPIYVWSACVDESPARRAQSLALLSPDERARAGLIGRELARNRFVSARGLLRRRLGSVLDVDPARLRFAACSRGKPYLAWPRTTLSFSTSRTGAFALGACVVGRSIGVDVEEVVPRDDLRDVARAHFDATELERLARTPWLSWTAAFYTAWTRREASLKALGRGIFMHAAEPAPAGEHALQVKDMDIGPRYCAAIAVEGDTWHGEWVDA